MKVRGCDFLAVNRRYEHLTRRWNEDDGTVMWLAAAVRTRPFCEGGVETTKEELELFDCPGVVIAEQFAADSIDDACADPLELKLALGHAASGS
jgi:hypothetical protein